MNDQTDDRRFVARNRKALHDFTIHDRIEAGIALHGAEVKSIRDGKVTISDAYAMIEQGELILRNLHITPYKMATHETIDPDRPRRLLVHRREITKLTEKTEQRGFALVPLAIYFRGKRLKVELGLAEGKKKYDKRQAIAEADAKRRIDRAKRRELK